MSSSIGQKDVDTVFLPLLMPPMHFQEFATTIKLTFPDDDRSTLPLSNGIYRVGSAPDSHLVINSPTMPMLAAEIHVAEGYLDLHPRTNARISVNGRRIFSMVALRNGDELCIADVRVNVVRDFAHQAARKTREGEGISQQQDLWPIQLEVPRYALRRLTGALVGKIYPICGQTIIGCDPDCDIVLEAPYISCRHARLHLTVKGAVVEDIDSDNGVYVNEGLVKRGVLRAGDELRLGMIRFLFCSQSDREHRPVRLRSVADPPCVSPGAMGDSQVIALATVIEVLLIGASFLFR